MGQTDLLEEVFGQPMNQAVVHQALMAQRANARQGTASVKTRSQVSGGGKKMRPQKHTGMSRQGGRRAPHWRGGGVAFGPHPRDYSQRLPKKMRRLALRCLLSGKVAEARLLILDELRLAEAKTKQVTALLQALGVETPALIATAGADPGLVQAAGNLPMVKTLPATLLNVKDLLDYSFLIMPLEAVRQIEELWGDGGA